MFFGWYVVAGTFVAQMLTIGFFTYSMSLLVGPVRAEFEVSLEQVMYSMTVGTLAGLVITPLCGALLDRYPVRWLMCLGALIFAGGLWATAQVDGITTYCILFGLTLSLTNGLAGSMASSTIVSRWFTSSRGKALGIAAIGTSAGGILLPALTTWWLDQGDWRSTLENMALFALLVVLPFLALTIRGKPEDIGLRAEGMEHSATDAADSIGALSVKDILRMPAYWYIALCLGVLFCVYSAVISNLAPYAADLGFDAAASSRLIMILAVASFVGKVIFGFLADKLPLKIALWGAIGLILGTLVIMSTMPGYPVLVVAAILMGLATGGMLPVWGAMVAKAFGLVSYGIAMGLMGPVITLSVMPGFAVMGRLYDTTGDYQMGMLVFTGLTVLSALLLTPLKLK